MELIYQMKHTIMLAARLMLLMAAALFPVASPAQERGTSAFVEFSGTVVPAREAEITPIVSGWLNEIKFVPGQYVRKGEILFEFSKRPTEVRIKQAEAQLAGARATLKNAEARLLRTTTLSERDVVSEADLQEAEANRDLAAANVAQAEQAVELLKIGLSQLEQKAPFDGIVSEPFVMENGWQDVGGSGRDSIRMAVVTQLNPIRVVGEVPYSIYAERQARFGSDEVVVKNVFHELILPDGQVYPHKGRLISGGHKFDPQTQKLRVWGEFDNPDLFLRPGLKVTIRSWIDN